MISQIKANTITQLVEYIGKNPPQRVNRYTVAFDGTGMGEGLDNNEFLATMVQIPSRTILFYPDTVNPWVPEWKVPLKNQWDDKFIVEFLVDENFKIRTFIETWMDKILNDGYGNFLYNGYNGDPCNSKMTIWPLNADGTKSTFYWTLFNVWPKFILPAEFDADQPNLLKMQVDFSYRSACFNY